MMLHLHVSSSHKFQFDENTHNKTFMMQFKKVFSDGRHFLAKFSVDCLVWNITLTGLCNQLRDK